jgi:hypothetical protein
MQNLNDTQTVLNTLIEDILKIAQQYPELPNTRDNFNPVQAQFCNAYHKAQTLLNEQDNLTLSNVEIGRILSWNHSQHTIGQLIDFIINQLKQHTPLKDNPNFQNYAYSGEKYQDDLTEPSPLYEKILEKFKLKFSKLYEAYESHQDSTQFNDQFTAFINEISNEKNDYTAEITAIYKNENQSEADFYQTIDTFMHRFSAYKSTRDHFSLEYFVLESPFRDVASVTSDDSQELSDDLLLSQASFFNPPNYFIVSGSIGATFGIVATLAYTIFALNPVFLTAMGVGLVTFLLASVCTEMYIQATAPTARI